MRNIDLLELGPTTPRRGNRLSKSIGKFCLGVAGWRFDGGIPDVSRAVLIVAPHTSNWDFLLGVAAMYALGLRVAFLGKHTLFSWPLGSLMRWLGGIPVDRRSSGGIVEETVGLFEKRSQLILALAPEGTRSNVERWKTGFYFVALKARVPIVPVAFDYPHRLIRIGGKFEPTGNLESDLEILRSFFSGVERLRES